jgi:TrmH family RNA methyltransferase
VIISRSNSAVKQIRALRSRKARDDTGLFFVEGIRIVGEALTSGAEIESGAVAPELLTSPYGRDLVGGLRDRAPVLELSADVFRSISAKEGPQGIGAVVHQRWEALEGVDPIADFCWVALDTIQDPGNLGAILRTSDAVGGAGIILVGPTTDPYDPSALRASMGAIFSQRLIRADFDDLVLWAREHDCMLVGTSGAAATDYHEAHYRSPAVLLMGSEQKGLSDVQRAACELLVSIPMVGRSDSLNLSVATAIVLYAIFNQQRHVRH